MDIQKKQELLDSLKNEFDDYMDYYDLMECIPGISEEKIESLRLRRCENGLSEFSHYAKKGSGSMLVSFSKFRLWYKNNFRPLPDDELCQ